MAGHRFAVCDRRGLDSCARFHLVHAVDGEAVVEHAHADLEDLRIASFVNGVVDIRVVDGFFFLADAADVREMLAASCQNGEDERVFSGGLRGERCDEADGDETRFEFRFSDGVEVNAFHQFFSFKNLLIHLCFLTYVIIKKILTYHIIPIIMKKSTLF